MTAKREKWFPATVPCQHPDCEFPTCGCEVSSVVMYRRPDSLWLIGYIVGRILGTIERAWRRRFP
jgi:hypothetical protein